MKLLFAVLIYIVSGVAFWIQSMVIHAIRGANFGGSIYDLIAISLLPVVAAVVTLEMIDELRIGDCRRGIMAVWMLVGIWVLGPLMMTIGASFSGGGFARPDTWQMLALAIPLFMHFTWMMSAYDGTLGALVVVTVWFVIAARRGLTPRLSASASSVA
jgi:hypothetical protein